MEVRAELRKLEKLARQPAEQGRVSAFFGRLEWTLGERVEATRHFQRALGLAPRAQYYRQLSKVREELQDYDGALRVLKSGRAHLKPQVLSKEVRRLNEVKRVHEVALIREFSLYED
jgi:tetratricopeptide (TPR) repeat protein